MPLSISRYVLGPVQTNTYLVFDPASREAVIIDPPEGSRIMLKEIEEKNLNLKAIWITHAHFDHIAGAAEVCQAITPPPTVGLHPLELDLYHNSGAANFFGLDIPPQPEPTLFFEHGQILTIGSYTVEVRHCPGHSSGGQVIFYVPDAAAAFSGDVIFQRSIGRTDFPGGSYPALINSIHTQILTLPPKTKLFTGHGPSTSVGEEAAENPFL
jgi:glyoxylase-like metal-dependent hydrolase (beta-lactamase superfamily II)